MWTGINKDKVIIIRNTINDIASKDFVLILSGKMLFNQLFPLAGNKAIVDRGWNHVYAGTMVGRITSLRSVSASGRSASPARRFRDGTNTVSMVEEHCAGCLRVKVNYQNAQIVTQ